MKRAPIHPPVTRQRNIMLLTAGWVAQPLTPAALRTCLADFFHFFLATLPSHILHPFSTSPLHYPTSNLQYPLLPAIPHSHSFAVSQVSFLVSDLRLVLVDSTALSAVSFCLLSAY